MVQTVSPDVKKAQDPLRELARQVGYYTSLGFEVPRGIKEPASMKNPVLVNYGMSFQDMEKRLGITPSHCGCGIAHQYPFRAFHQWGWIYEVDLGRKTRGWSPERAEAYRDSNRLRYLSLFEGIAAFIKESMSLQKELEREGHDASYAQKLARMNVLKIVEESECNNFIPHFLGSLCDQCQKAPALYLNGSLKVLYFQVSQNPCWGIGYKKKPS